MIAKNFTPLYIHDHALMTMRITTKYSQFKMHFLFNLKHYFAILTVTIATVANHPIHHPPSNSVYDLNSKQFKCYIWLLTQPN